MLATFTFMSGSYKSESWLVVGRHCREFIDRNSDREYYTGSELGFLNSLSELLSTPLLGLDVFPGCSGRWGFFRGGGVWFIVQC